MPRHAHKQKKTGPNPATKGAGQLRIIGGELRGRKLAIADVPGLRPTTDRVRETLFNWLQFELAGSHCLDAFAGSGALGFEALSRGAATVTLLEKDSQAERQLRQHATTLSAAASGTLTVHGTDSLQFLASDNELAPFDVVFIDPPFCMGLAQDCIDLLTKRQWLAERAWIYVETEQNAEVSVPNEWQLHREKQAGQVISRLYFKDSGEGI